jgi:hypothetical protein
LPEKPSDISIQKHCGSYEYNRSSKHITPQAAGNSTRKTD